MMSEEKRPEPTDIGGDSLTAEWRPEPGAYVEIRRGGGIVCSGTVDVTSSDSRRVWLAADGNESRRLFDEGEGYEVFPLPSVTSYAKVGRRGLLATRQQAGKVLHEPSSCSRKVVL
jgi:hypothetical protein